MNIPNSKFTLQYIANERYIIEIRLCGGHLKLRINHSCITLKILTLYFSCDSVDSAVERGVLCTHKFLHVVSYDLQVV